MTVKDKLMVLYMEFAWDIVLRPDLTNKQKIRILNNKIHDELEALKDEIMEIFECCCKK